MRTHQVNPVTVTKQVSLWDRKEAKYLAVQWTNVKAEAPRHLWEPLQYHQALSNNGLDTPAGLCRSISPLLTHIRMLRMEKSQLAPVILPPQYDWSNMDWHPLGAWPRSWSLCETGGRDLIHANSYAEAITTTSSCAAPPCV